MKIVDSFDGFDPTQVQGNGCCGAVYWDAVSQTWKQKNIPEDPPVEDCSEMQQQLDQANATISNLNNQIVEKDATISNLNNQIAEKDATISNLNDQLNNREQPPTTPDPPDNNSSYDPEYSLSPHESGITSPLTSTPQERILTLNGRGGDPNHYYKFTFSPDTAGETGILSELVSTTANVKDVVVNNDGVVTGLIKGGERQEQITIRVKAMETKTLEEFPYGGWGIEYVQNKLGGHTSEHEVDRPDELVLNAG